MNWPAVICLVLLGLLHVALDVAAIGYREPRWRRSTSWAFGNCPPRGGRLSATVSFLFTLQILPFVIVPAAVVAGWLGAHWDKLPPAYVWISAIPWVVAIVFIGALLRESWRGSNEAPIRSGDMISFAQRK